VIFSQSDMADVDVAWEVKGSISPSESVAAMLKVIEVKGQGDSGTFWCWDGRVSNVKSLYCP
jgi:hypothetical protein